jgi:hypothetical protein
MGPAGELVVAAEAGLLEAIDPLVGSPAGDVEAVGQVGDGVEVELVVFEEPLALLVHGNTFPGHGHTSLKEVLPMS